MPHVPTMLNTWVIALAAALDARGVDARALVKEAGLGPEVLDDPSGRHPLPRMADLFELAIARTNDPCIGLDAARFVQPTTYLGLGLAILASRTLEDAMRRGARYSRVVSDAIELSIDETPDGLRQTLRVHGGAPLCPPAVDLYMVGSLKMGRLLTGTDVRPVKVFRTHSPSPEVMREHERILETEVIFGAEFDAFLLDAETAQRPLPMANPALALANDEAVRAMLASVDGSRHVDRVREEVIARLGAGVPDRTVVARALGLGEKTLQRRLADEGTSFQELVDATRLELAQRYLVDRELTLAEIAYRLGFAEQSGFARAFRRWTGVSPTEYRQAPRSLDRDRLR